MSGKKFRGLTVAPKKRNYYQKIPVSYYDAKTIYNICFRNILILIYEKT
jgi:hypothetical protein